MRRIGKMGKSSTGMPEKVAALLCYVLGWVSGLVFLIIERRSSYVRRHALLSIIIFGAISVASLVFGWLPAVGGVISWVISFVSIPLWIVLMILAGLGVIYRGELEKPLNKP